MALVGPHVTVADQVDVELLATLPATLGTEGQAEGGLFPHTEFLDGQQVVGAVGPDDHIPVFRLVRREVVARDIVGVVLRVGLSGQLDVDLHLLS